MASSSGRALDSKQIHEQLHDSDSFIEFIQDSDTDIFDRIYPGAEISGPDLGDSFSNSDDGQVSGNVGGDVGVNDSGSGYNDEAHDNEDWVL
jgi:hypothetical protein